MKKVITPAVKEVSERICDVSGQPAVAKLVMWFGYGSKRDGDILEVDLASQVAEDVLQHLQSKFPQFQPQDRLEDMLSSVHCPNARWG